MNAATWLRANPVHLVLSMFRLSDIAAQVGNSFPYFVTYSDMSHSYSGSYDYRNLENDVDLTTWATLEDVTAMELSA